MSDVTSINMSNYSLESSAGLPMGLNWTGNNNNRAIMKKMASVRIDALMPPVS